MTDGFERITGRPPEGVWSAPGRVNLIGEHTDYNDGFMLPVAIDRGATAAAARRPDGRLVFRSLQKDAGDDSWLAYPEGVAAVLAAEGLAAGGADVVVDSDVPEGAGLSSSAALEVSVALALTGLAGEEVDRTALALACRRAEEEVAGTPCGVMDQLASLFGRAGHALFIDARALSIEPVPLGLEKAGLALLVVDTRVAHSLRSGGYAERRRECEAAAAALGASALRDVSLTQVEAADLPDPLGRRARHVVSENQRVLDAVDLLRSRRVEGLGPLFAASHASLRDDFEVSTPELDAAVEGALAGGAVAARMTGGGFGGSAVVIAPSEAIGDVTASVESTFAAASLDAPRVLRVEASDGARWVL